jgi:hypothetical protein
MDGVASTDTQFPLPNDLVLFAFWLRVQKPLTNLVHLNSPPVVGQFFSPTNRRIFFEPILGLDVSPFLLFSSPFPVFLIIFSWMLSFSSDFRQISEKVVQS